MFCLACSVHFVRRQFGQLPRLGLCRNHSESSADKMYRASKDHTLKKIRTLHFPELVMPEISFRDFAWKVGR